MSDARSGAKTLSLAFGLVVAAVLLPVAVQDYFLYQLTQAGVFAIAILGLGLITGVSGQISLGQGAFYAAGAYLSAILMTRAGFSVLPAAGLSTLVCFVAGWGFGRPAARLEGIYLAMATFALAVAMPQVLKSSLVSHWTGASQGLELGTPILLPGVALEGDTARYFTVLVFLTLAMLLCAALCRGRLGRSWRAVRDDARAARACGIDPASVRSLAFAVGAALGGLSGALAAVLQGYVSPDSFGFSLSLLLFVGMVVGGAGTLAGAVIGGLFIVLVPNVADSLDPSLTGAVFGGTLILVTWLCPEGIAGLIRRWAHTAGNDNR